MVSMLYRFFAICALGVLLTACNHTQGNQNMFDGPPRAQKDRAMVIIGMSGRPNQIAASVMMQWAKENATFLVSRHHITANRHCGTWGAVWCEKPITTYHISLVVPGTYTLAWAQHFTGLRTYRTHYKGRRPTVTVKAGEIVYIGDYAFDFEDRPIRPYSVVFRPQAALKALMKQSKGKPGGTMVVRRPSLANWPQKSANEPR